MPVINTEQASSSDNLSDGNVKIQFKQCLSTDYFDRDLNIFFSSSRQIPRDSEINATVYPLNIQISYAAYITNFFAQRKSFFIFLSYKYDPPCKDFRYIPLAFNICINQAFDIVVQMMKVQLNTSYTFINLMKGICSFISLQETVM